MEVIADYWFSDMRGGCCGIVIGEDEYTGGWKAYIGVGGGYNQETDKHIVMEYGQKLSLSFIEGMAEMLKFRGGKGQ